MTYIDDIAPVRATGPIAVPSGSAAQQWLTHLAGKRTRVASSPAERHASAAGPRPTGTDRLLPAWAMGTG